MATRFWKLFTTTGRFHINTDLEQRRISLPIALISVVSTTTQTRQVYPDEACIDQYTSNRKDGDEEVI
jgi:hypothetical protein